MAKLNKKNLSSFGAEHLAELLIDVVSRHPLEKRKLRNHLLEKLAPAKIGPDISKRCQSLARGEKSVSLSNLDKLFEEIDLHFSNIEKLSHIDGPGAVKATFHLTAATHSISLRVGGHDDPERYYYTNTIDDFLKGCQNLLKKLILKHRPSAELLCQEFLDLPEYGYSFLMLLEPMASVMGKEGLSLLEVRCQEIKDSYGEQIRQYWERKSQLTEAEEAESNKIVKQVFLLAHIAKFILLTQGKTQAFLDDMLPDGTQNIDPDTLAKITNDLIKRGMLKGAKACITFIPKPPADIRNINWYGIYDYVLRLNDQDDQAHELRWEFLKKVRDHHAVMLYIDVFENNLISLNNNTFSLNNNTAAKVKTKTQYEAALLRLKNLIIHEFDYEHALEVCFKLIKEDECSRSMGRILNAFIEHHGVLLSRYPKIPWMDYVKLIDRQGVGSLAATLMARELIKEQKKSGQNTPKHFLKLAQTLYKRARNKANIPSHEDFIETLSEKDDAS